MGRVPYKTVIRKSLILNVFDVHATFCYVMFFSLSELSKNIYRTKLKYFKHTSNTDLSSPRKQVYVVKRSTSSDDETSMGQMSAKLICHLHFEFKTFYSIIVYA